MMLATLAMFAGLHGVTDTIREREVVIPGEVPLPGVLTLPATGRGPFPAVVIVHGSGAGDRDMTIGPNKPYRDMAHGLAARGIAVLRYDKRARVAPASYANRVFTLREETIDDAVSAFGLLRSLPEIDATRLHVVGHSLGGYAAPRIAATDGALAGMVLMAGAWVTPLPELMLTQFRYIASVASSPAESTAVTQQLVMIAPMVEALGRLTAADSSRLTPILGAPPSYWLDMRAYDQVRLLRDRPEPTLILQGERDYQVTPGELDAFLAQLGARKDTRVIRYPGLNHLFIMGTGAPRPAEYATPGKVDARVMDDLAAWVLAAPARKDPR
jgi:dienelactone hydrolase